MTADMPARRRRPFPIVTFTLGAIVAGLAAAVVAVYVLAAVLPRVVSTPAPSPVVSAPALQPVPVVPDAAPLPPSLLHAAPFRGPVELTAAPLPADVRNHLRRIR